MESAPQRTVQALAAVVKDTPVGTNLALLHLLWALVSGTFLVSRGAVFAALLHMGLSPDAVRRSWQALHHGAWAVDTLLAAWHTHACQTTTWQPHVHGGYRPLPIDITAFWRPRFRGRLGTFFHRLATRAMPGIGVAVIVQVGQIAGQRLPLLRHLILAAATDTDHTLMQRAFRGAHAHMLPDEVAVHDAGASIAALQDAQIDRFVLRLAVNSTARRNTLPPQAGRGRPATKGALIRPIARCWNDRTHAATPPDVTATFSYDAQTITASGWHDLVLPTQAVDPAQRTFTIWRFDAPQYATPLLVATPLQTATAETVFRLYLDRWSVEQVPLVTKQLLGCQRQFVFAAGCSQRLAALALLAGNILTVLAASLPALPSGFWDRQPQRTPGRLRRVLAATDFSKVPLPDGAFRKKASVTAHVPKGIQAHRRQKAAVPPT